MPFFGFSLPFYLCNFITNFLFCMNTHSFFRMALLVTPNKKQSMYMLRHLLYVQKLSWKHTTVRLSGETIWQASNVSESFWVERNKWFITESVLLKINCLFAVDLTPSIKRCYEVFLIFFLIRQSTIIFGISTDQYF